MLTHLLIVLLLTNQYLCVELPENIKEIIATLHQECIQTSGITEEMYQNAYKGIFPPPPDDQKWKCYVKCTFDTPGLMEDGVVDANALLAIFPEDLQKVFEKSVLGCAGTKGVDDCDTAFLTSRCYYEKDPENFIMI